VAALLGTQHVARAADLQIPHGDLEARAELGKLTDGRQPLLAHLGQHLAPTVGEIGIGMAVGTTHAAADLMQLGQTHVVGILDDQCVHIGDIHTGFDDGSAHQNGDLTGIGAVHHIAHLLLGHAAVGHRDGGIGEAFLQLEGRLVDVVDAVVEIVHLTAAGQFPTDGIPDDGLVVLQHIGLYRLAAHGGLLQHAHVADARQGHVQGAGDGSGGEGEHVDALCHLLDALLVGHAEALLLVHHQQAQILEEDILLQDAVGTHQQVHLTGFYLAQGVLKLVFGAEAAHHVHLDGIARKALHCGEVVLARQNGGGHQNGGLFARQQALHNSAEGHLGFAEAHVAAQQAVHGYRTLHIPLDLLGADQLILGLLIGEGLFKGALPVVVGGEGEAGVLLAGGVQLEQLLGKVGGALFGTLLGLLPCSAPQLGQADMLLLGIADVFAHQIKGGGGDKDEIGAGKGDFDIVAPDLVYLNTLHAHKPADAVVLVHHQIAGMQVGKALNVVFVGRFAFFPGFSGGLPAFTQQNRLESGIFRTGRQGVGQQTHLARSGLLQVLCTGDGLLTQQLQQVEHPAAAACQQQDGVFQL